MNRRDVLKSSSLILGYAITGGTAVAVLNGCTVDKTPDWVPMNLSHEQAVLAEHLAETILPASTSGKPGATDAQVVRFIDAVLDSYAPEEKTAFIDNLSLFDSMAMKKYDTGYTQLDQDQRLEVMEDMMGGDPMQRKAFRDFRGNTIVGFCYSEVGAKQVLKFDPVPGHPYQGCIDFEDVGTIWSITR
ncbi:MAG: gluconate 2-dehydrogenase subunit 3 family protein [Saprospiraceae bacterium]|nr:gluconate 2-dehydrogenase subunit 3 family protein [Saprospiraceae bacterium]